MSFEMEQVQPKTGELQRLLDQEKPVPHARRVEAKQGEILILCPRTSTPVTTGLRIEWVVFGSLPPVAVPLRCPACGQTHRWKPQDAWISTNPHWHEPDVA
jgi:hypothetical protein